MSADTSKNGVKNPTWTCPNCGEGGFKSQMEMVNHALPCKQGRMSVK